MSKIIKFICCYKNEQYIFVLVLDTLDDKIQKYFKLELQAPVLGRNEIMVKVKVSHSLLAVGAVWVRVPLFLGYS